MEITASNLWFSTISFRISLCAFEEPNTTPSGTIQAFAVEQRPLPSDERALFYRKYWYRQPTAQIAAELGLSPRAVEGRLYRIRQKLRQELGGDFCGE